MKNKGFTLVELLVTITVLGIILAFSLVILNKLTVKNKDTEYKVYSDTLLQAAKIYNDEYHEDTFAKKEYGCAKVKFSTLEDKELISKITVKNVNCGYRMGNNESSGVIIRKVKNKYYYETVLFCKETGAQEDKEEDHVVGANGEYFYELLDSYCNSNATTDNTPPKVYYRNNRFRTGHFYNSINMPQPQIKITDNGVGLTNKSDINYKWSSKSNTLELLRFTTNRGVGSTRWKNIPLSTSISSGTDYAEHLKVTVKNVSDLAENNHSKSPVGNQIDGDKTSPEDHVGSDTGTFYIDNTKPNVSVSNKVIWRNSPFSITMNVKDPLKNHIRSGIRKVQYKLTNTYANRGNAQTINISGATPTNTNNGNNSAASGDNNVFRRTITINKPGNYSLEVYAIDWSGNEYHNTFSNYYQYDPLPPTCGAASTSNATPWINRDRTVTIGCGDQTNLSQCTQVRYSKTFGESNTGIITIADNAGNKTNCTVVTKVDKTPPTCRSRGGSDDWRKASLTIYGDCNDNRSGCRQRTYSKVYSGNVNTEIGYAGVAYDNAGNSVTCSQNQHVHIDNSAPRCELVYDSYANTPDRGIWLTLKCYDNYGINECDHWAAGATKYHRNDSTYVSEELMELRSDTRRHVKDKAGNTAYCSARIVPSTCEKYETISSKSSFCGPSSGYCNCAYYYCPSGQSVSNAWSQCYASTTLTGDAQYSMSYGWNCKGYKTYTDGVKCGYHLG